MSDTVSIVGPRKDGWCYAWHMGWKTYLHPLFMAQLAAAAASRKGMEEQR